MPRADRPRIDYMPGKAANAALAEAARQFPELSVQALIDKLVLTGLSALAHVHWQPPVFHGRNRDKWRLPIERAKSLPTGDEG